MANTIITKNKSTTGDPVPGDIEQGELAINLLDEKLFSKNTSDAIFEIGGGAIADGAVDGDMLHWDQTTDQAWEVPTGFRMHNGANPIFECLPGGTKSGGITGAAGRLILTGPDGTTGLDVYDSLTVLSQDTRVQNGFFELSNAAGANRLTFDLDDTASTVLIETSSGTVNDFRFNGIDVGLSGALVSAKPAAVTNYSMMWACGDGNSGAIYNRNEYTTNPLDNVHTCTWRFNTPTTSGDPTSTLFRLNSGTPASVTEIYIDDNDALSEDAHWFLSTIEVGDVLTLRSTSLKDKYYVCLVDVVTDETGWWTIEITLLHSGGTAFLNVDHVQFELQKTSAATGTAPLDWLRADTADTKTSGILRFNDAISATFGTGDDVSLTYSGAQFNMVGTNLFNISGFSSIAVGDVDVTDISELQGSANYVVLGAEDSASAHPYMGYNIDMASGAATHLVTGAVSGVLYQNTGDIRWYGATSQTAGTSATAKMILSGDDLTVAGNIFPGGQTVGSLQAVTGQFGSVEVDGLDGSSGVWAGYSIGGRLVFMDNVGSAAANRGGLYDDQNNQWIIEYNGSGANFEVELHYGGSQKLVTEASGVTVTGNIAVTGLVDGKDVAGHVDDATLHFTEGSISIPLTQISDVTALAAEVNLLDLAGLTAGDVLSADSATTASWKAQTGSTLDSLTDTNITSPAEGNLLMWDSTPGEWVDASTLTQDYSFSGNTLHTAGGTAIHITTGGMRLNSGGSIAWGSTQGFTMQENTTDMDISHSSSSNRFINLYDGFHMVFYDSADLDSCDFHNDTNDFNIAASTLADLNITGFTGSIKADATLLMLEQSAAESNVANYGQFWWRDDAPNIAFLQNDAGTDRPIGYNSMPPTTISASQNMLLAEVGHLLHKSSGGAVTLTCAQDTDTWDGATWAVHNDDTEDLTITDGASVTVYWIEAGSAPAAEDVVVEQGGIVTVYKLSNTEFWVWGAKEAGAGGVGDMLLGTAQAITADKTFNDSVNLTFGTGDDCDMYFNGTDMYLDMSDGADFRLRGGASNDLMILANDDGTVVLYNDGTSQFATQNGATTGNTSGANIKDHGGNLKDVGFNVLPDFNFNATDTLEAMHCGHITGKDNTTAYTLTGPTSSNVDFPVEGVCQVVNLGSSVDYTISDTATCTMYYMDGDAAPVDIAGSGTLAPGGWISIWRYSTTAIYITGSGFTV